MRVLVWMYFRAAVTRGAVKEAHGFMKPPLRGCFLPTTNRRYGRIGGIVSNL